MIRPLAWAAILLMVPGRSGAQDFLADSLVTRLPFIEPLCQELQFPVPSSSWDHLHQRWTGLKAGESGQIQILHLGGSHVQGGSFSQSIRKGLATGLPDGQEVQPGFFFPYALAGTNNPGFLRTSWTGQWEGTRAVRMPGEGVYGLSALRAVTREPMASARISHRLPDGKNAPFQTVRLYYDAACSNLHPEPFGRDCPSWISVDTSAGWIEWAFDTPQEELDFVLLPSSPEDSTWQFVLLGIQFINREPGPVYHAAGANGASLRTFLGCALLEEQMEMLCPDLVILGIGVNDAYAPNGRFDAAGFANRYDALIRLCRRVNPGVAILLITNNDTWYKRRHVNQNVRKAVEAVYELAARHEAAIWDQFALMGGINSITAWQKEGLAKRDRIHFTPSGYALLGQMLAQAILQEDAPCSISQMTAK